MAAKKAGHVSGHGFVCLCFLIQIWSGRHSVSATTKSVICSDTDYLQSDACEFVRVSNETITSLSELTDGVFSIELSAEQSGCRTGTRIILYECLCI